MTTRCFPPSSAITGANPITINGRTYSAAGGSYVDAPDADALVLGANGWTPALTAGHRVGTTAQRPTAQPDGRSGGSDLRGWVYLDTTLSAAIVHDGAVWRNVVSGAAV